MQLNRESIFNESDLGNLSKNVEKIQAGANFTCVFKSDLKINCIGKQIIKEDLTYD